MKRAVRYQAAIIQDDQLLLLKVWDHAFSGKTFWVIPGGGRHHNETEEACVKREVYEETHLHVEIDRLILDEPDTSEGMYQRAKTYACRIIGGDLQPGSEPEVDTPDRATITHVGWFDLHNPNNWDPLALNDPVTYPMVQRLRAALGYGAEGSASFKSMMLAPSDGSRNTL
jgi:ADP-ribose pyrophosphatase YjhB (NUDIX family)